MTSYLRRRQIGDRGGGDLAAVRWPQVPGPVGTMLRLSMRPTVPAAPSSRSGGRRSGTAFVWSRAVYPASRAAITAGILANQPPMHRFGTLRGQAHPDKIAKAARAAVVKAASAAAPLRSVRWRQCPDARRASATASRSASGRRRCSRFRRAGRKSSHGKDRLLRGVTCLLPPPMPGAGLPDGLQQRLPGHRLDRASSAAGRSTRA